MHDGTELLPVVGVRLVEGRCGSTLLMQLLATSDRLVLDDRYPAEYRFLSYFARLSALMTEPYDADRHPGVTPFFFGPEPAWGPIPFDSDVVDIDALRAPLLRSMWAAWTTEVRTRHPGVSAYAEKLAIDAEDIVTAGIPLHVIDLVRDPRDVLASIRAFTGTGVDGFGRSPGESEGAYLHRFLDRFEAGFARIAAGVAGAERIVVRYEDLVANPVEEAARIGGWLGVALDPVAARSRLAANPDHVTSPSAAASIGRWRTDLDATDVAAISDRLAAAARPLGYDL